MKLGIVGLPNVGKSTLFNSMTLAKAEAANYPFCTIDPNVGIVAVPDERLTKLINLLGLDTRRKHLPNELSRRSTATYINRKSINNRAGYNTCR